MFDGIIVAAQSELELDGLLEAFEAPVSLLFLQCWDTEKFIYRLARIVCLELFGVVVLVLDVDITALRFVVVFVFKVVPELWSASLYVASVTTHCSGSESAMKSSSSDIFAADRAGRPPLLQLDQSRNNAGPWTLGTGNNSAID